MNATPAVSQTPIASDPAQLSSTPAPYSVNSGGKVADFAAALNKAGAKPHRKSAPSVAVSGPDGGQLPGTGNPSPPPIASAGATGATPDGASAGRPASADDSGSAAAIGPSGGGPAPASASAASAAGGASTATPSSAQATQGTSRLAPGLTFSLELLAGADVPGARNADDAALAGGSNGEAPAAAGNQDVAVAPTTASVDELTAAKAAAVERPTVAGGVSVGARAVTAAGISVRPSVTAAAATAANDASASAPSGATGGAAAQANAAASDPTSLGATAAVMAAATGALADNSTTADSTLSPAIDSATPGAGRTAGDAGANGAPAAGLPVAAGQPAGAAAASTAAAITASSSSSATDRHARSDTGAASSDASAGVPGAAQLSGNSAGTAALGAAAPGMTDAASAPTLKVTAGVDTPEFGQGIADRLSWIVDNNLSSAKLQVNPPQLGPIEVRIAVQGDHAQVWLTSHSAVTRDALESSSPKLREMLGAQGFGQVSVDISQRNFQDRSAYAQPYERSAAATISSAAAVPAIAASLPRFSNGAVDAYA